VGHPFIGTHPFCFIISPFWAGKCWIWHLSL